MQLQPVILLHWQQKLLIVSMQMTVLKIILLLKQQELRMQKTQ